jgi:predicted nuclease of predicted toxin-antitoxin system
MRLYLDEHVPVALAPVLTAHGVDCLTTLQAHNLGLSDESQLAFATENQRALVTFNRKDFLSLARQWQDQGRSHAGLILSQELPLPELLRRFRRFLQRHQAEDLTNHVLWLTQ